MSALKLKKGDKVKVMVGKDKGKTGTVERVLPRILSVVVSGVNIATKHAKAKSEQQPAGRIELAVPLTLSKVMLICPNCNKTTRVAVQISGDTKQRVCKHCGKSIEAKNG